MTKLQNAFSFLISAQISQREFSIMPLRISNLSIFYRYMQITLTSSECIIPGLNNLEYALISIQSVCQFASQLINFSVSVNQVNCVCLSLGLSVVQSNSQSVQLLSVNFSLSISQSINVSVSQSVISCI